MLSFSMHQADLYKAQKRGKSSRSNMQSSHPLSHMSNPRYAPMPSTEKKVLAAALTPRRQPASFQCRLAVLGRGILARRCRLGGPAQFGGGGPKCLLAGRKQYPAAAASPATEARQEYSAAALSGETKEHHPPWRFMHASTPAAQEVSASFPGKPLKRGAPPCCRAALCQPKTESKGLFLAAPPSR